jgi:hypothetical protein
MIKPFKKLFEDKDLDTPIKLPDSWHFLRKGKIRIIIIFEDGSHKDYYRKLKNDYFFDIKKKAYLIVPECMSVGKNPTCIYPYNNPLPYNLKFQRSKLTGIKPQLDKKMLNLRIESGQDAEIYLDSKALKVGFTSNLVNKMYQEGFWTMKNIIVFVIVLAIIIIVILHFTGVINITELLGGQVNARN